MRWFITSVHAAPPHQLPRLKQLQCIAGALFGSSGQASCASHASVRASRRARRLWHQRRCSSPSTTRGPLPYLARRLYIKGTGRAGPPRLTPGRRAPGGRERAALQQPRLQPQQVRLEPRGQRAVAGHAGGLGLGARGCRRGRRRGRQRARGRHPRAQALIRARAVGRLPALHRRRQPARRLRICTPLEMRRGLGVPGAHQSTGSARSPDVAATHETRAPPGAKKRAQSARARQGHSTPPRRHTCCPASPRGARCAPAREARSATRYAGRGGAHRSGGAGMPARRSLRRCESASASAPSRGPRRSSAPSSSSSCSACARGRAPRVRRTEMEAARGRGVPHPTLLWLLCMRAAVSRARPETQSQWQEALEPRFPTPPAAPPAHARRNALWTAPAAGALACAPRTPARTLGSPGPRQTTHGPAARLAALQRRMPGARLGEQAEGAAVGALDEHAAGARARLALAGRQPPVAVAPPVQAQRLHAHRVLLLRAPEPASRG